MVKSIGGAKSRVLPTPSIAWSVTVEVIWGQVGLKVYDYSKFMMHPAYFLSLIEYLIRRTKVMTSIL
tara:strand:- start:349 stop:549 length:201 start_codon:yes stop_codon:yes gene_type:complete